LKAAEKLEVVDAKTGISYDKSGKSLAKLSCLLINGLVLPCLALVWFGLVWVGLVWFGSCVLSGLVLSGLVWAGVRVRVLVLGACFVVVLSCISVLTDLVWSFRVGSLLTCDAVTCLDIGLCLRLGRDLPVMNTFNGKSDTYCEITLDPPSLCPTFKKVRTETQWGSLDPVFQTEAVAEGLEGTLSFPCLCPCPCPCPCPVR
jgi:hypothetical protein